MDLTQLPFNRLVGIESSGLEGSLLSLRFDERLTNHLNTLHASALFALAEASSGELLMRCRGHRDDIGGVVRRAQCKYSKPASADIHAVAKTSEQDVNAAIAKVEVKGRILLTIEIDLCDDEGAQLASFAFDWFLAKSGE